MSPLIEINDPALNRSNTILVDVRAGKDAFDRYLAGHLQKAIFVNLESDLSDPVTDASQGGRHPLRKIEDFATLLGNAGISPDSHVVVYDDKAGAMGAARLWWMLRAIGHTKVQVLNGGLKAAIDAGIPLSTEKFIRAPTDLYFAKHNYEGAVDIDEAGIAAYDNDKLVIDVRETPRYLGQTEPIDLIAGHIPGAVNLPYVLNIDANGKFLPPNELREAYEAAIGEVDPENVILHCGSGVTACHTLLGMAYAGIEGPKMYVGSWSEWSRRDLPRATSERY
jgi:thiosulfate/3-mercaptopyruvate sulfurtransferase